MLLEKSNVMCKVFPIYFLPESDDIEQAVRRCSIKYAFPCIQKVVTIFVIIVQQFIEPYRSRSFKRARQVRVSICFIEHERFYQY